MVTTIVFLCFFQNQQLEFFAIVPQVDMSTARDFAGFFHRTGTIIRDPKVFQFYSVTHFILPGLNANSISAKFCSEANFSISK